LTSLSNFAVSVPVSTAMVSISFQTLSG
jgi:hypothetical protein